MLRRFSRLTLTTFFTMLVVMNMRLGWADDGICNPLSADATETKFVPLGDGTTAVRVTVPSRIGSFFFARTQLRIGPISPDLESLHLKAPLSTGYEYVERVCPDLLIAELPDANDTFSELCPETIELGFSMADNQSIPVSVRVVASYLRRYPDPATSGCVAMMEIPILPSVGKSTKSLPDQ